MSFPASATPPRLLLLGDSLSAAYGIDVRDGWVNLLAQKLKAAGYPHRVINASISGETTSGGRRRLPELLSTLRPVVVIIELGANDGLRGMPLVEIEKNLHAMVAAVAASGGRTVLLPMEMPPNYGPDYANGFRDLYSKVAVQFADTVVTPFFLRAVMLEPALLQADGLHPTAAAQPRMLDAVWPAIENVLTSNTKARHEVLQPVRVR